MPKRSRSPEPSEESGEQKGAIYRLYKWRMNRQRPPNAEQAALFAFDPSRPASLVEYDTFWHGHLVWYEMTMKILDRDEGRTMKDIFEGGKKAAKEYKTAPKEGQEMLWFPRNPTTDALHTTISSRKLPDPTKKRVDSIRLNIFVLPELHHWTPGEQAAAKESFEQQLAAQLKPEVGGEARILFPSSPSRYIDIKFEKVKQYAPGFKLELQWKGHVLGHKKVGVFLPDNHIVLGMRGISKNVNLVKLLQEAYLQLKEYVKFKDVQVFTDKRIRYLHRRFPKRKIAILAAFREPRYHAGMLPGSILYKREDCKLWFEERDDLCQMCRFWNIRPFDDGGRAGLVECIYCGKDDHCECTCRYSAHPEREECSADPYPVEAGAPQV